jgi:hypothetical protein
LRKRSDFFSSLLDRLPRRPPQLHSRIGTFFHRRFRRKLHHVRGRYRRGRVRKDARHHRSDGADIGRVGYKSTHAARGDPPPSRPGAMPQGSAQHAGSLQGALRRRKSLVVSAHVDAGSNIRAYLAGALGSKCAALIRFLNCDLSELPSYSELTT